MKRILALTAMLCMVYTCALAAAPGKITGPEGGIEYATLPYTNNKAVIISQPGEYTIEDWTVEDEYEFIWLANSLTGSVKLTLKNVNLQSKMGQALIWNTEGSITGNRSLTLIFENSQIHATNGTGVMITALDDSDCTLTITGEKPTIIGEHQGIRVAEPYSPSGEHKGRTLIDVAANDAVITGEVLYGIHVSGKEREACELRITGEGVKISSNQHAIYAEHYGGSVFVSVTGEGAQVTGGLHGVYMDSNDYADLTLGTDVTLTGEQAVELFNGNGRVLLDGNTWPDICAEISENQQGDQPEVYGPYGALTALDFAGDVQGKKYLHTFVTEMPPEVQTSQLPKTGDTQDLSLYAGMLTLAAVGMMLLRKRKEA